MLGKSPVAIPLSYESTKYPAMEDQIKALLRNREEALAVHELARSRMADRQKSMFFSVHKGRPSMVRFKKPKNNLSQENEAKMRRTILHYRSTGTGYLQVATFSDLANP